MNQPFGNPFFPYQQPGMQPAFQPQQPMSQAMAQSITAPHQAMAGRIVAAVDEIVPQEVPTDGTFGFFPVKDGSAIYAKTWNGDGTITTIRFAPVEDKPQEEQGGPTLFDIADQLSDIQDLLREAKKPAKATKKKGTSDDPSE